MRGKKAKALRRIFKASVGRAPASAAWGGKVVRVVDHLPTPEEKVAKVQPRVLGTLFEKVIYPSEWRQAKKMAKGRG